MSPSTIEWTDETWNPTVGCSKVSPGCDHCYAISVAHRAMQPVHQGLTVHTDEGTDWTGVVRCLPERLRTPLRWRKPRRVFVDSMSDLFHPSVPEEFIAQTFAAMALARRHSFQVLTKRPQRMAQLVGTPDFERKVAEEATEILCRTGSYERWQIELDGWWPEPHERSNIWHPRPWPLPNVWLGTSIESARYLWRADHLRRTPTAIRFLSLEPLLGPLEELNLEGIGWVIAGGESGPGARPMHPSWVRDIRNQCVSADVAFLFKQWGAWAPTGTGWTKIDAGVMKYTRDLGPGSFRYVDGPDEATHVLASSEENAYERMSRMGKKAAGRELDGRTWDQMPA